MRALTTPEGVEVFMTELGRRARIAANVYFTGGATAVLHGWRATTIDIDLKIVPDTGDLLRALPEFKESLALNVELAAPDDFIPELPGWQERSIFIATRGLLSFFHYDLYAQALSKIERGHVQDTADVRRMMEAGMVERDRLLKLFERIEPELYRYPAIDPPSFRRAVLDAVRPAQ